MIRKKIFKTAVIVLSCYSLYTCSDNEEASPEVLPKPMIIAHRGGKVDFPENSLLSFEEALRTGVDGVEMDLQVSQDNVPVLYHPGDLNVWTNGSGKVSAFTLAELKKLNAAWNYGPQNGFPYRNMPQPIPTLKEALAKIPSNIPIILDMKSVPAGTLVESTAQVLNELNAWSRVVFYSITQEHLDALKSWPQAQVFEAREITRKRLLEYKINGKFIAPDKQVSWIGFELIRSFDVNEALTLGIGSTAVTMNLWDKNLVKAIKGESSKIKIVLFGINIPEDYKVAAEIGADAVMTDAPTLLVKTKLSMK
ncbi:glycerophosphodiester phosphodiesterase family protein [Chryseobacterium sp.]|uniref:glycerophosphodiester phosphodiesterase family protein n=1 Tax=Chryseobacterium sp. TaxID=1871047 RepID=UPI0031D3875F